MPQDFENILRKSLDEVDRARKRIILAFLILFFAVQAGLVWLGHLSQTADIKTMVICSVAILLVGEVAAAVVTWGIVVEATRKTLKAIALLSKE
jgi:hypothetical protein